MDRINRIYRIKAKTLDSKDSLFLREKARMRGSLRLRRRRQLLERKLGGVAPQSVP